MNKISTIITIKNKKLIVEVYNGIRDKLEVGRDDVVFTQSFYMFCKDFVKNYNDIKKFL